MAEEQTDNSTEEALEPQPGLMHLIRVAIRVAVSAGLGTALWVFDLKVYGETGPLPDVVKSPIFGAWCGAAAGIIWGPIIELAVPRATEKQRWLVVLGSMILMGICTGVIFAIAPTKFWWGLRMLVIMSLAAAVVEAVGLSVCSRGQEPGDAASPDETSGADEPSDAEDAPAEPAADAS